MYLIVDMAALIAAAVPLITTVPEPSPVTVTPALDAKLRTPLPAGTVSVVVSVTPAPSTSLTETPVMLSGVSSFVDCAPGTVLTGASLTGLMVSVTVAVLVSPLASVTV